MSSISYLLRHSFQWQLSLVHLHVGLQYLFWTQRNQHLHLLNSHQNDDVLGSREKLLNYKWKRDLLVGRNLFYWYQSSVEVFVVIMAGIGVWIQKIIIMQYNFKTFIINIISSFKNSIAEILTPSHNCNVVQREVCVLLARPYIRNPMVAFAFFCLELESYHSPFLVFFVSEKKTLFVVDHNSKSEA